MAEPLDLDAIRKRGEAATPGPWHLKNDSLCRDYICSCKANHGRPTNIIAYLVPPDWYPEDMAFEVEDADQEFIAFARTDIPALLDEIDRLTAITSSVRRCYACHKETLPGRAAEQFDEEEAVDDGA